MELFGTPADVIEGRAQVCVLRGDAPTWMRVLAFTFGRFASAGFGDPPYHLTSVSRRGSPRQNDEDTPFGRTRLGSPSKGFMGTTWDGGDVAHRVETWAALGMCLKPGAYTVMASGTRTYHRLACAIEDAGFEIEDMLAWLYAQGMPKGGDVSKRIDAMHGAEREVLGEREVGPDIRGDHYNRADARRIAPITAPATEDAQQWEGHSSTIKPALEPCVLAQWPLDGSIARNLLTHGCGALNIDACRIGVGEGGARTGEASSARRYEDQGGANFAATPGVRGGDARGRWPSGVTIVHMEGCEYVGEKRVRGTASHGPNAGNGALGQMNDDGWESKPRAPQEYTAPDGCETIEAWACVEGCPGRVLDAQAGVRTSNAMPVGSFRKNLSSYSGSWSPNHTTTRNIPGDSGGASRFFFQAKATGRERWVLVVCDCGRRTMRRPDAKKLLERRAKTLYCRACGSVAELVQHATVKPLELDEWIARLICPTGSVVVVPFAGTGSEVIAALEAGARVIAIELEPDHVEILTARLAAWGRGDKDLLPKRRTKARSPKPAPAHPEAPSTSCDVVVEHPLGQATVRVEASSRKEAVAQVEATGARVLDVEVRERAPQRASRAPQFALPGIA